MKEKEQELIERERKFLKQQSLNEEKAVKIEENKGDNALKFHSNFSLDS